MALSKNQIKSIQLDSIYKNISGGKNITFFTNYCEAILS
jgi:hypothetical protein